MKHPPNKKIVALLTYGNLSSLIIIFYISFVYNQAKSTFNPDTGFDNFQILLIASFTIITLAIAITGAISKSTAKELCQELATKEYKLKLENSLTTNRIKNLNQLEIEKLNQSLLLETSTLQKIKTDHASNWTVIIAISLILILVEGFYSIISFTFALIAWQSFKSSDLRATNTESIAQEEDAIIKELSIKTIAQNRDLMILTGQEWRQKYYSAIKERDAIIQSWANSGIRYNKKLQSLTTSERIITITIISISIVTANINNSEFVIFLLLAGRLIKPIAENVRLKPYLSIETQTANDESLGVQTSQTSSKVLKIYKCNSIIMGSIYDNIVLQGNTSEINQGLNFIKNTSAANWINELPKGINTIVREQSKAVPNHIKQLIAIARTIQVNEPKSISIVNWEQWLHPETYKEIKDALEIVEIELNQTSA